VGNEVEMKWNWNFAIIEKMSEIQVSRIGLKILSKIKKNI